MYTVQALEHVQYHCVCQCTCTVRMCIVHVHVIWYSATCVLESYLLAKELRVPLGELPFPFIKSHTHTCTRIYIPMYMYMYAYSPVGICLCGWMGFRRPLSVACTLWCGLLVCSYTVVGHLLIHSVEYGASLQSMYIMNWAIVFFLDPFTNTLPLP